MPIIGARAMLPELSEGSFFTALLRYDLSFAGDPAKKNISNLQIAPTLNIMLPEHWFVTFYPTPDIRINYGDPITGQTGRLFLPIDVLVGRDLTKNLTVSLEISVPVIKDYPVYDFKAVTRLNMKFDQRVHDLCRVDGADAHPEASRNPLRARRDVKRGDYLRPDRSSAAPSLFCQTVYSPAGPCRRSFSRSSIASIRSSLRSRWTS
jgi:hypothetical protein